MRNTKLLFLSLFIYTCPATAANLEAFDRDLTESPFITWGGGSAFSNQFAPEGIDQRVVNLILPKNSMSGPVHGPNMQAGQTRFLYGTFEARLKTPKCSTQKEGNVSGLFTFFNDGSDSDANGISDNSEIDFEWLCAEPESIYLTMWTDYNDATAQQKRVSRKINLALGRIEFTRFAEGWGQESIQDLSASIEAQPAELVAIPDYNASERFYEYGFTWSKQSVIWWMVHPRTR